MFGFIVIVVLIANACYAAKDEQKDLKEKCQTQFEGQEELVGVQRPGCWDAIYGPQPSACFSINDVVAVNQADAPGCHYAMNLTRTYCLNVFGYRFTQACPATKSCKTNDDGSDQSVNKEESPQLVDLIRPKDLCPATVTLVDEGNPNPLLGCYKLKTNYEKRCFNVTRVVFVRRCCPVFTLLNTVRPKCAQYKTVVQKLCVQVPVNEAVPCTDAPCSVHVVDTGSSSATAAAPGSDIIPDEVDRAPGWVE